MWLLHSMPSVTFCLRRSLFGAMSSSMATAAGSALVPVAAYYGSCAMNELCIRTAWRIAGQSHSEALHWLAMAF